MTEQSITKARELRQVVEQVFGIDILTRNRRRERVDARMVYSKILKDSGFTYVDIGKLLSRDHSTIIHMYRGAEDLLVTDSEFRRKFLLCKNSFLGVIPIQDIYSKEQLAEELKETQKKLSELYSKIEELENYKSQKQMEESKYGRIYKVIRDRTPKDQEDVVERRIKLMFNTNYEHEE